MVRAQSSVDPPALEAASSAQRFLFPAPESTENKNKDEDVKQQHDAKTEKPVWIWVSLDKDLKK